MPLACVPQLTPTLLGIVNLANQRIGSGIGCPTRSKHFFRRNMVLQQRVADKKIDLRHVVDVDMPANFLKVDLDLKLEKSVRYATNSSTSRSKA